MGVGWKVKILLLKGGGKGVLEMVLIIVEFIERGKGCLEYCTALSSRTFTGAECGRVVRLTGEELVTVGGTICLDDVFRRGA